MAEGLQPMSVGSAKEKSRLRGRGGKSGGARKKECVVVGIGNPLMGDDGFGIEMARSLRELHLGRGVLVLERQTMDIAVLDYAKRASRLVIVDAVRSGRPPGSVVRFIVSGHRSLSLRVPLSHEQRLYDLLTLARKSGMRVPPTVVVGVEPADCTPGNGLSAEVKRALPRALEKARDEVEECAQR